MDIPATLGSPLLSAVGGPDLGGKSCLPSKSSMKGKQKRAGRHGLKEGLQRRCHCHRQTECQTHPQKGA